MRKWKWLFVNDCKSQSQISAMMEFLNSCQDGINSSSVLGDYVEKLWYLI
jgi:hypothetical protein